MNSIPLIKGNTPQEINTSIIALKKALSELEAQDRLLQGTDKDVQNKIKQINELIEGINTHLTTIDGQITALQPVDTVTSGNMQSVTSNAVAGAFGTWELLNSGEGWSLRGIETKNGKYLEFHCQGAVFTRNMVLGSVPEKYRPTNVVRFYFFQNTRDSSSFEFGFINVLADGTIMTEPNIIDNLYCFGDSFVLVI